MTPITQMSEQQNTFFGSSQPSAVSYQLSVVTF
jgi:hypothetical protein